MNHSEVLFYEQTQIESLLECPKCANTFVEPVFLPCGTSICYKCLLELAELKTKLADIDMSLNRMERILDDNGVGLIGCYYKDLRLDVQLATEKRVLAVHEMSDTLLNQLAGSERQSIERIGEIKIHSDR